MKKAHLKEIERINKNIPKELTDNLIKKELAYPVLRELAMKALNDPEVAHLVSEEDRANYQAMLDSGYLDEMIDVVDPEIEKKIDEYLDIEFEKARKLGRLPPPQAWPKLKTKSKKNYVNNRMDTKPVPDSGTESESKDNS